MIWDENPIDNVDLDLDGGIRENIPWKGLKEIGLFAFNECSDLKDIYLPSTLTDKTIVNKITAIVPHAE